MQFNDLPTGPGEFFKPNDLMEATALLVEVKKFEPQRPGQFGPKDSIHADVHVFATPEDVKNGSATVKQGVIIQNGPLVRDLKEIVGGATVVKLGTAFFKQANRDGAVWRAVDAATKKQVQEYGVNYAKALEADMEAAPDFG